MMLVLVPSCRCRRRRNACCCYCCIAATRVLLLCCVGGLGLPFIDTTVHPCSLHDQYTTVAGHNHGHMECNSGGRAAVAPPPVGPRAARTAWACPAAHLRLHPPRAHPSDPAGRSAPSCAEGGAASRGGRGKRIAARGLSARCTTPEGAATREKRKSDMKQRASSLGQGSGPAASALRPLDPNLLRCDTRYLRTFSALQGGLPTPGSQHTRRPPHRRRRQFALPPAPTTSCLVEIDLFC